jgi:hypothetical protein
VSNLDQIERARSHIDSPVMLYMIPCAFKRRRRGQDRLAAVIPRIHTLKDSLGDYITFFRVFWQWFRSHGTAVEAIDESAALKENFPQTEGSIQTARILPYVANN